MRTTVPAIDIVTAVRDKNILGDVLSPAQEAALRTLYGLTLPEEQAALVERCLGRPSGPPREYREAAFICGRRSGKSDKLAANVAIYESFFRSHTLSAGERGVVLLMAQNMRAAQVVANYIKGKIERSPILSQHVVARRALELDLDNGITIAIHPSSFRAIRGLSVVTCICDEIAFWFTETEYANPDVEVIRAVRPAMATFEHAKLILVSSPYAKAGVLWDMWQARQEDEDTLVWHAPTELMNPTVKSRFLEKEKARDPENFLREYEAEFTDAVSSFIPSQAIDACVVEGRIEVPPVSSLRYVCAIDAAFKGDRFTLCIAHLLRGKMIIDLLTGWEGTRQQPVQLSVVLPQIQQIAKRYRIYRVVGDQFGAEPLKHALEGIHLTFIEQPFTLQSKADMYGNLRSMLVDGKVELLDHAQSIKELRALDVELLPGGQSRVGHPRRTGARDDFADVIALAVAEPHQDRGPRPIESPDDIVVGNICETVKEFGPPHTWGNVADPYGSSLRPFGGTVDVLGDGEGDDWDDE